MPRIAICVLAFLVCAAEIVAQQSAAPVHVARPDEFAKLADARKFRSEWARGKVLAV